VQLSVGERHSKGIGECEPRLDAIALLEGVRSEVDGDLDRAREREDVAMEMEIIKII